VSSKSSGIFLRIVDDTGLNEQPRAYMYAFDTPAQMKPLSAEALERLAGESARPGLYIVETSTCAEAVIIPSQVQTLKDLQLSPRIHRRFRSPEDIIELINVMELWASARVTGSFFSLSMRRDVLLAILQDMFRVIAGDLWGEFEKAIASSTSGGMIEVARRTLRAGQDIALAEKVCSIAQELAVLPPVERVLRLVDIAQRHMVVPEAKRRMLVEGEEYFHWPAEFALRLASGARGISNWAGSELRRGVASLLETPALARAARLVVMAQSQTHAPTAFGSDLYEDWDWQ
jgi:hypothetical protein